MSEIDPQAAILREFQRALHYLYDPIELHKSRLIQLLKVESKDDPALTLRRAIIDTIQSMKPDAKVPHESNARRIYQVLTYRFVEQSSQKEVATSLALSIRQLRRLESQSEEMLAERFLSRYSLAEDAFNAQPGLPAGTTSPNQDADKTKEQELEWLRTSISFETIRISELIDASLKTSSLLAEKLAVHITCMMPSTPLFISAQVTTLRQALLNLLTAGFQLASGGTLRLEVIPHDKEVKILFKAASQKLSVLANQPEIIESIKLASNLLTLSAGTMEIKTAGDEWTASIRLPGVEQVTVMVIDDNEDALRLIERYLTASRFHFVGVRDPVRVIVTAEEVHPHLILLDVMLPGIDGWELLGRLREHPQTENVPVVISTILPQESLAATLGAVGFLRKPFTRERLLQVLEQALVQTATKSD